jgi:lysyl-tRNA synthetase class 2
MADAAAPTAPAEANKTYLDEVTGEQVSKSELKKRQKARQKEEEKQKKAAAAPPKPIAVKKSNAEADEEKLNPNV